MLCNKCNNDIPEGVAFCPFCGATPSPANAAVPGKKKGFSALKLIALILTLVSLAALAVSYFVILDTSIEKIPAVSLIMGDDVKEIKDYKKEIKSAYTDIEEAFERSEDELDKKEIKIVKNTMKVIKAMGSSISIKNIQALSDYIDDVEDIKIDGQYVIDPSVIDSGDEIADVLNIVTTVILVFTLLCAAFCAFGGFFRINGLVITGMILSVLYALIFCGFVYVALFAAVDIALCIVISKSKKQAA